MDIGQLRVGKGYLMVTVGQQGYLKENLTELHIIVRTTGEELILDAINFKPKRLIFQRSPTSQFQLKRLREVIV